MTAIDDHRPTGLADRFRTPRGAAARTGARRRGGLTAPCDRTAAGPALKLCRVQSAGPPQAVQAAVVNAALRGHEVVTCDRAPSIYPFVLFAFSPSLRLANGVVSNVVIGCRKRGPTDAGGPESATQPQIEVPTKKHIDDASNTHGGMQMANEWCRKNDDGDPSDKHSAATLAAALIARGSTLPSATNAAIAHQAVGLYRTLLSQLSGRDGHAERIHARAGQAVSAAEQKEMDILGITRVDSAKFCYGEYRYDNLSDALRYARAKSGT